MSKKQQKDVLTDNNEKGNEQMNKNKTQDEFLFYPRNAIITEDIATQKVLILANLILNILEGIPENFKISFGYRALNKLLFSNSLNKAKKLDCVQNGFDLVSNKSIEDLAYCLEYEPLFIEQPQMYFSFDINENTTDEFIIDCKPLWAVNLTETTDPKNFLGMFKNKFNLFDLMIDEYSNFAKDLIHKDLINFYFKFDVKYAKNQEISDKSTMKVVFQLADKSFLNTYSWSFKMKAFLAGQSEPTFESSWAFIEDLVEDSCI